MGNESCLIIDLFKNPAFTAIAPISLPVMNLKEGIYN